MQACQETYLIFVISFTRAGFFSPKFLHPKTMQNTQKLQQIPPKGLKYAVLRVQFGKIYTGQNFFTRAPPVVPVTNMRYGAGKRSQGAERQQRGWLRTKRLAGIYKEVGWDPYQERDMSVICHSAFAPPNL